jgi:hypothetical protein
VLKVVNSRSVDRYGVRTEGPVLNSLKPSWMIQHEDANRFDISASRPTIYGRSSGESDGNQTMIEAKYQVVKGCFNGGTNKWRGCVYCQLQLFNKRNFFVASF